MPRPDADAKDQAVGAFLLTTAILALGPLWAVATNAKLPLHQAVNAWHAPWADALMPWVTEGANGWVPVLLALALLWRSWRCFLMMGMATAFGALAVQALKHLAFPGMDRPSAFLGQMPGLHVVAGVDLHHHFTFPSGHSTAAFGLCFALAVVAGRRLSGVALAVAAAVLAFSRVYLSQHFTQDALAGAALGSAIAFAVYRWLWHGRPAANLTLDRSPLKGPMPE
jgi:membrane-associated phospholipid phosphatase